METSPGGLESSSVPAAIRFGFEVAARAEMRFVGFPSGFLAS